MRRRIAVLSAIIVLAGCTLQGQGQAQSPQAAPLTEKEVLSGLKKDPARLASMVTERGVDFDLTPEIEKKLRKAKADDTLVDIIRKAGPTARAQAAKQGGQPAAPRVSQEEYQAFRAIQNELDPDKQLQMIADYEKKFPSSSLLTYAYMFGANAYQQKNDVANTVAYGERSIKLKEDNLPTLILLASMLPQPQFLKDHEQDREKYLGEAETYADRALKLLSDPAVVPKQPNEADAAYAKRKDMLASGAHASLGMIHLERSQLSLTGPDKEELGKAEKEYGQAISLTDRPNAQDYYRLAEAYALDGKLDEAIASFSKAGELAPGSVIKTYADQRILELKKRKAQASPAPNP
jgi:tetratricopeptide (TPR) repeat protein